MSIQTKVVPAQKAGEFLVRVVFEFLKEADVIRSSATTISADTLRQAVQDAIEAFITQDPKMRVTPEEVERNEKDVSAEAGAGWLDDNPARRWEAVCNVNPYCWVYNVVCSVLALKDAFGELDEAIFPRNDGKAAKKGRVATRLDRFTARRPGRPIKDPQGRPWDVVRRAKADADAMAKGRQPGKVGRPKQTVFRHFDSNGQPVVKSKSAAYKRNYMRRWRKANPGR